MAWSDVTSEKSEIDPEEEENLKRFLLKKINDIKGRMRHDNPQFEEDQSRDNTSVYKASTLSKVQAIR